MTLVHEAAIVSRLIHMATSRVPEDAVLRRVHVRIGALTGLSPDSMRFYFEALGPGRADLEVSIEPLRAACPACGRRSTPADLMAACPWCSASGLQYENGLELDLVAIEVDDAVDDPDRREDPG